MSNKVGRNDKCPCGSGKKYKKCCLAKGIKFTKKSKNEIESSKNFTREFFQKYNNVDLVATLSALSLLPSNHGKNLRLEYLTLEALSVKSAGSTNISRSELQDFLNEHYPSHYLEDPPENLFTENVVNTLGNNVVYGGNFEQGAFTLNTLISAIHFNIDAFPKAFIKIVNDAFLLLLKMSNSIALSVGHSRNLYGDHESSDNFIDLPEDIETIKASILFPLEWIEDFCRTYGIDRNIMSHFTLGENDRNREANEIADKDNPLIVKPFARLQNGFMATSPTSIVSALIHFVWKQANEASCQKQLIQMYHKTVWKELTFFMNKIGFTSLDFALKQDQKFPIVSALYRFDVDKIALLSFIYDEGEDYDPYTPCHPDPMKQMELVQQIQDDHFTLIKEQFPNSKFIDLTLYSTIGREYMLMFPTRDVDTHTLILSAFKFLCWIKSEDHDRMELWYFLEAKERFTAQLEASSLIDPLNYYYLYNQHNKSFYLGDEARPDGIFLVDGLLDIISKATRNEDKILVFQTDNDFNHPVLVPVIKLSDYIPRYINPSSLDRQLEFYIPDYPIDIWLRAKNNRQEIVQAEANLYWEFSEAIAYWLWQLRDILCSHLEPIELATLTISFTIADVALFDDLGRFGHEDSTTEEKFEITVEHDFFHVKIPGEIIGHLSHEDNRGERLVIKHLLKSFGDLLHKHGLENSLTDEVIQTMIDNKMPIGLKKMFIVVNSEFSKRVDPRGMQSPRLIQESRKQWYMDEILPLLGNDCPPVGSIKEKGAKLKIGKKIVFLLLGKLRALAKPYDSRAILFELMGNYEFIIHSNALTRLRTPTRLHCFAEYEDIVEEINKLSQLTDETSLATRCLIEHFVAEPGQGHLPPTQQLIDDMIAIMAILIWWGNLGDRINFDLFNIEIDVLPSGRIGTNFKEETESYFQNFTKERVREFIEGSVESFSSYYNGNNEQQPNPIPDGFDSAFKNEVGIGFSKLGGIVSLLIDLGLDQGNAISSMTVAELRKKIHDSFEIEFSREEIAAAIQYLTLEDRGDVTMVPHGFNSIDISPWRYNRRLSYLQRPLILIRDKNEEDGIIHWSPRHLDHGWHYINYLIMSGRFRTEEKSELERQISLVTKHRGKVVQDEVIKWFFEKTSCVLDKDVDISPKGRFASDTNIGDIDVLAIDHDNKIIYAIECKRTEPAKNTKELVEQVEQYFGSGSTKGYFEKHERRHDWLEKNLTSVGKEYGFDTGGYTVISFFVSYEILGIQFINRRLPLPVFSLFEFKNFVYLDLLTKLGLN